MFRLIASLALLLVFYSAAAAPEAVPFSKISQGAILPLPPGLGDAVNSCVGATTGCVIVTGLINNAVTFAPGGGILIPPQSGFGFNLLGIVKAYVVCNGTETSHITYFIFGPPLVGPPGPPPPEIRDIRGKFSIKTRGSIGSGVRG